MMIQKHGSNRDSDNAPESLGNKRLLISSESLEEIILDLSYERIDIPKDRLTKKA